MFLFTRDSEQKTKENGQKREKDEKKESEERKSEEKREKDEKKEIAVISKKHEIQGQSGPVRQTALFYPRAP